MVDEEKTEENPHARRRCMVCGARYSRCGPIFGIPRVIFECDGFVDDDNKVWSCPSLSPFCARCGPGPYEEGDLVSDHRTMWLWPASHQTWCGLCKDVGVNAYGMEQSCVQFIRVASLLEYALGWARGWQRAEWNPPTQEQWRHAGGNRLWHISRMMCPELHPFVWQDGLEQCPVCHVDLKEGIFDFYGATLEGLGKRIQGSAPTLEEAKVKVPEIVRAYLLMKGARELLTGKKKAG